MRNKLFTIIILSIFVGTFAHARQRYTYVAYVPEWLNNSETIISKTATYLENNGKRYKIKTSILPTKRSLNRFITSKDGCYLPTNPDFINNFTNGSEPKRELLFLPLETVNLQRYVLRENKESPLFKAIGTVRVSDKVTQLIKNLNPDAIVNEIVSESVGISMLRRNRFDGLYLWGVSKLAESPDLYIIPNSSLMSLDVGLVCYKTNDNQKLINAVKKKFKK